MRLTGMQREKKANPAVILLYCVEEPKILALHVT